jgi:hypothetical protein
MAVQKSKKSLLHRRRRRFLQSKHLLKKSSLVITKFNNYFKENNAFLVKCRNCGLLVNSKKGCLQCYYNHLIWSIKSPLHREDMYEYHEFSFFSKYDKYPFLLDL